MSNDATRHLLSEPVISTSRSVNVNGVNEGEYFGRLLMVTVTVC